jgi:hypothetical protein
MKVVEGVVSRHVFLLYLFSNGRIYNGATVRSAFATLIETAIVSFQVTSSDFLVGNRRIEIFS